MQIFCFDNGPLNANMYVIATSEGFFIVDPCSDPATTLNAFKNGKEEEYIIYDDNKGNISGFDYSKVKALIATHGHFDHIAYLKQWNALTNKPLYIHSEDSICLSSGEYNVSSLCGMKLTFDVEYKDILTLNELSDNGISVEVLHTPGHSKGSCVIVINDSLIFTGDTLFAGSAGRTDFIGGDSKELMKSLALLKLRLKLKRYSIFPGHGPSTISIFELSSNPFLA